MAKTLKERLYNKLVLNQANGCLEWSGTLSENGYGLISMGNGGKRNVKTHRVMWEITNGPIPTDSKVLHSCDNPKCCKIEHLFLGSNADNTMDMIKKGRYKNGMAKLTIHDAREIRRLRSTRLKHREIAKIYGVCLATVGQICRNEIWREDAPSTVYQHEAYQKTGSMADSSGHIPLFTRSNTNSPKPP